MSYAASFVGGPRDGDWKVIVNHDAPLTFIYMPAECMVDWYRYQYTRQVAWTTPDGSAGLMHEYLCVGYCPERSARYANESD